MEQTARLQVEAETQEKTDWEEKQVKERQTARALEDTQDQSNKVESVSEEEQTAKLHAKAKGRAEVRRSNTKDIPSSVIEKMVTERAKLAGLMGP